MYGLYTLFVTFFLICLSIQYFLFIFAASIID